MTITSTTSRVDYVGNGVTTAFAVPFAFFGASELTVIQRVVATGVETTLALSTHYTVSGGNGSTGTVTAVTAPPSTVSWTILRNTARTQEVDYQSNDPFPAETHERALDRVTAIVQEVERDAARAVRVAPTDAGTVTLPSSVARAGLYLAFDGAGAPIAAVGTAGPPITPFMATLLDDPDAATARATLGTLPLTGGTITGDVAVTGALVPSSSFLRNRIINGGMSIWQRGTSFSVSGYTADRWFVGFGGSPVFSRSADVPNAGFQFSMSVSGSNFITLAQRLESVNVFDLAGQSVTVSFWIKQTSGAGTNSIGVQVFFPTATDNYTSVTGATTNLITATSGWTYVTTTFASGVLISAVANGMGLSIHANTASSATFLVTGVQLEVGTAATPFERRQYGQELALCQRYYELNGGTGGGIASSTRADFLFSFAAEKRTGPTASIFNSTGGFWQVNGGNQTVTSLTGWATATVRSFGLGVSASGASFTTAQPAFINGGVIAFSAEL